MSYRNYFFFGYVEGKAPFQKYETSTDTTALKQYFSEEHVALFIHADKSDKVKNTKTTEYSFRFPGTSNWEEALP